MALLEWEMEWPEDRIVVGHLRPGGPFMYRPGEVLVDSRDDARARERFPDLERAGSLGNIDVARFRTARDPVDVVDALRAADPPVRADVNTVLMASARYGGTPNYPGGGYTGNPNYPGGGGNSAVPAAPPDSAARTAPHSEGARSARRQPVVAVLDSGIPSPAPTDLASVLSTDPAPGAAGHARADIDEPDTSRSGYLDRIAGHGVFIAGIVHAIVPSARIYVDKVFQPYGDTDDFAVAEGIAEMEERSPQHRRPDVVNMSFAGYDRDDGPLFALARSVRRLQQRGTVVVAAAGNDGSCRPMFPAALDGVIGVAALDCYGPAEFTNYGPWVRACAPGVDVVSRFFEGYDGGRKPEPDGFDPDRFDGWARWSGTSFAAPRVAAAIAARMSRTGQSAVDAAHDLIDGPGLLHLPNLGTVVNVV